MDWSHEWPKLRWNNKALTVPLAKVRHRQGRLLGQRTG